MKCEFPSIATLCPVLLFVGTSITRADDPVAAEPIPPGISILEGSDESLRHPEDFEGTSETFVADEKPDAVDADATEEPSDDQEQKDPSIVVRSFGTVVHVGPDGKVEIKKFGSDEDDADIQQLQSRIRSLIDGMRGDDEAADESDDDKDSNSAKRRRRGLPGLRGLFRLNEDGALSELDELLDLNGLIGGSFEIQGLDGKSQIKIDSHIDPAEINRRVQKALEDSQFPMQADVIKELNEAMQRMHKSFPNLRAIDVDVDVKDVEPSSNRENDQLDAISKKLDGILDRLEKLETDVDSLKKRTEI